MDNRDQNPAHQLVGLTLEGGWVVTERIDRRKGQTGSNFSVGYKAKNKKDVAYVKALDLNWAFQQPDRLKHIENATRAFNFEKELYGRCNQKSMKNVVTVVGSGRVEVDSSPLGQVDYIIMEPADGDLRSVLLDYSKVELYWACAVIHEVANGLRQLHAEGIAHQDIKPSNVLEFSVSSEFKIADLGAASIRGETCPRDGCQFAGEWYVAPPEHQYGHLEADWFLRRIPADLYALGSLIVFLFTGLAVYSIAKRHLPKRFHPGEWRGPFPQVIPYLKNAYSTALEEVSEHFQDELPSMLFEIVKELCEPDPTKRGWKKHRGNPRRQYSMERYLARLGNIRARARVSLMQKVRDVEA